MKNSTISVTAYDWVPAPAQGLVRDFRLRWALNEAGFPYEVEIVPLGTQREPANLARQPFGQVPTLTVDGTPVFESGACVWRIAEESDTLLPDDQADRDRCLSWLFGALNTIEPPLLAIMHFVKPARDSDGERSEAAQPGAEQVDRCIGRFVDALGDRDHIVGDRFTVADLMLTAVLLIADRMDLLSDHPKAKAYFDRHSSRPAFRKAQADQMATFAENAAKYEGTA